jgi:ATP-dependent Lon protease
LPKQLKKNAIKHSQLRITEEGLKRLIENYAREAGVRNLEKQIAKLCRKVALRVASGRGAPIVIKTEKSLEQLLGPPPYSPEKSLTGLPPGTATGLAWTQYGGEVLFVESLVVPGRGGLVLTGTLGKVMQESGNIAYSFVRDRAKSLDLPRHYFERHTIHVHVPAGATPKDGPSAGVTLAASLFSLLSRRPLPPKVAMTGEMTLTGRVLPVGGVKEKLLAARRAGVGTVLFPKENEKDLKEIEPEVKAGLKLVPMATVDDCLRYLFH